MKLNGGQEKKMEKLWKRCDKSQYLTWQTEDYCGWTEIINITALILNLAENSVSLTGSPQQLPLRP